MVIFIEISIFLNVIYSLRHVLKAYSRTIHEHYFHIINTKYLLPYTLEKCIKKYIKKEKYSSEII